MNYLKHYCNLIRKAENRTPPEGYTEKHHIFPKSIFGENNRIVILTAREHYIAHALIEKVFIKRYGVSHWKTKKMTHSHILMKGKGSKREVYYNSYLYEGAKVRNSRILTGIFSLSEEEQWKIRSNNGKIASKKIMENKLGIFSLNEEEHKEVARLGGIATKELKKGIFAMSKEEKSEAGKKAGSISGKNNRDKKIGIFSLSIDEIRENGKKGAQKCKELGVGVYSMSSEQRAEYARIGASYKWICLETGFTSTAGGLTRYQKARGIDTSKRKRLE